MLINKLNLFQNPKLSERIIILSPHSDDAAFSLSGFISYMLRLQDVFVTLITVFSRSSYTINNDYNMDIDKISAMRKREDFHYGRYCMLSSQVWLELIDAPLRTDYKRREVCTLTPFCAEDQRISQYLELVLNRNQQSITTVFAPMALGNHIDHRIVMNAAITFTEDKSIPLFLYEDLPYASNMTLNEIEEHVESIRRNRQWLAQEKLLHLPYLSQLKRGAALCYLSQVNEQVLKDIRFHVTRIGEGVVGGERIWEIKYVNRR